MDRSISADGDLHVLSINPTLYDGIIEIAKLLPKWFTKTGIQNLSLDIKHQKGFVFRSAENQIFGFITYFVNQGEAQIGWMGVHPDHHRKEVGFKLLKGLENYLIETGVSVLLVSTLGDAVDYEPYARTRAFYRKNGFSDFKKILHSENPECEEELILRKELITK
jgi:GNAT superfamily N-acetyltransferase